MSDDPKFDAAFKAWFEAESDPLAVMMGMKPPDHPISSPEKKP
jgi:hypothetical protein